MNVKVKASRNGSVKLNNWALLSEAFNTPGAYYPSFGGIESYTTTNPGEIGGILSQLQEGYNIEQLLNGQGTVGYNPFIGISLQPGYSGGGGVSFEKLFSQYFTRPSDVHIPYSPSSNGSYYNANSYGNGSGMGSMYAGIGGEIFASGENEDLNGGIWDLSGDGKLQKKEADNWWIYGIGNQISINNAYIDWSGLTIPEGKSKGDIFAISTTDAFKKLPYETASTYGGTSFEVISNNKVMVLDQLYHYKYRPNNSVENLIRNFMNWSGKPQGQGTDFMIHYLNPIIQIK